jgi:predicted dehydrogenase
MGISLGLVGLGAFGHCFAELFKAHPLVDRIALCDREPERMALFADKPSWKDKLQSRDIYPSLDDICRSDLDALVIITQHWLHAPQCIQAMLAGKHVYSAVPLVTLPDGDEILDWCDRLVETRKRTGMHYMLGETTYFHPQAMFCRRQARKRAFGDFVYTEGEYFHSFDSRCCDLREVRKQRLNSKAGEEWEALLAQYLARGAQDSPMHYPTHSTSGPISVMNAHAVKVSATGYANRTKDPYFAENGFPFSNIAALFTMSNGATMRIGEFRECSLIRETFRIYGTKGAFENDVWIENEQAAPVTVEAMRDPLPPEVVTAFKAVNPDSDFYGGHGGSHAYLVHEFVDAIASNRHPAINVWEAVRYMAPGVIAHKSAMKDGEVLAVPDWGNPP